MKRANSSHAEYALILGDNELANNFVTVRRTDTESVEVKRSEIVAYLLGEDGK